MCDVNICKANTDAWYVENQNGGLSRPLHSVRSYYCGLRDAKVEGDLDLSSARHVGEARKMHFHW